MAFHLILLQVRTTNDNSQTCRHIALYLPRNTLDDILGDFDHDGIVEKKEIDIMRKKLHDLFDKNANGEMDPDEIRSLVDKENDMSAIYQKLDTNMDEKISMDELDNRWEHLGHELSPEEVADWVSFSVQLPQYAPNFRRHYISGYSFPLLIEDDGRRLVDIGIENPLHQQQLKLFIRRRIAGIGKGNLICIFNEKFDRLTYSTPIESSSGSSRRSYLSSQEGL